MSDQLVHISRLVSLQQVTMHEAHAELNCDSYIDLPAPNVTIMIDSVNNIGQPYSLTCSVMVVPHLMVDPTIQWTRQDGAVVVTSTGTSLLLNFNLLMKSDSGLYTCTANVTITGVMSLRLSGTASREILLDSKHL